MQKKDYQKLLKCPFCGGEAKYDNSKGYDYIICDECGARNFAFTKEQAFDEWNARVDVALTRSDIEKMVRLDWRDNRPMVADCGDFNLDIFYMRENEYTIYASKGILGGEMYVGTTQSEDEAKQKAKDWVVDIVCSAFGVEE